MKQTTSLMSEATRLYPKCKTAVWRRMRISRGDGDDEEDDDDDDDDDDDA